VPPCTSTRTSLSVTGASNQLLYVSHFVAVQVEFERQNLKPGYYLIGSRFEAGSFQAMGQLDSTCTAPPLTSFAVDFEDVDCPACVVKLVNNVL
jgi:hypothetical protein